jgi:hypothetical protein
MLAAFYLWSLAAFCSLFHKERAFEWSVISPSSPNFSYVENTLMKQRTKRRAQQNGWTALMGVRQCRWQFTAQLSLYVPTLVTICTVQWSLYVPCSGYYMYRTVVTICTVQWLLYVPTVLSSVHTVYLCVLCGSENKHWLFPYTTLTDWFL